VNTFSVQHVGDDSHERVAAVARAVLSHTGRLVAEVRVVGIAPLLEEHVDAAAVETLLDAGMSVEDGTLTGRVPATSEVREAVLALFSDPLLEAVFFDDSGQPVFARKDNNADFASLSATAYERVAEELPTDLLARLSPTDCGESVLRLPDGENPAAGTALAEYAFTALAESGSAGVTSPLSLWAVLDALDRDVERVQFRGLPAALRQQDPDALAMLRAAATEATDVCVAGDLPADERFLDALRSLWGDGVHYLYCADVGDRPLVLRESPGDEYCYLSEREFGALDGDAKSVLRRSGRWR